MLFLYLKPKEERSTIAILHTNDRPHRKADYRSISHTVQSSTFCFAVPLQQFLQLPAVGGDELLFQFAAFDLDGDIIVVRADKGAAALKVRDLHQLCFRKMQNRADALGFFILQIQDHLGLGVVDDALAVFAVLQREEVIEVLRCTDGRACLLYTSPSPRDS